MSLRGGTCHKVWQCSIISLTEGCVPEPWPCCCRLGWSTGLVVKPLRQQHSDVSNPCLALWRTVFSWFGNSLSAGGALTRKNMLLAALGWTWVWWGKDRDWFYPLSTCAKALAIATALETSMALLGDGGRWGPHLHRVVVGGMDSDCSFRSTGSAAVGGWELVLLAAGHCLVWHITSCPWSALGLCQRLRYSHSFPHLPASSTNTPGCVSTTPWASFNCTYIWSTEFVIAIISCTPKCQYHFIFPGQKVVCLSFSSSSFHGSIFSARFTFMLTMVKW